MICIAGPMIGQNAGRVTTQGEILADLLARDGQQVLRTSAAPGRFRRPAEIAATILSRRREISALCVQVYSGPGFLVADLASLLGRRLGLPLVMHVHGGNMPEFMASFPRWTRRVFARSDAIVAPSPFLARALAEHGLDVQVIPNVIDPAEYNCRPRRALAPRLLWMRTFHPIYNPEMAVRVLARVQRAYPEASLVMAGQEKGIGSEVRRLAEAMDVARAIRFTGFLGPEGKRREGDLADIFLNTNHVDNTPVSVIEACAMGLPVVATDVGGLRDLVKDGETALLVPDDDDEAMAGAVTRLLGDPDLAARLSEGGRGLAERCSWPQVRPLWERLFDRIGPGRSMSSSRGTSCSAKTMSMP